MPRIARGALEEGIFHVLNRGNHRQTLFHREDDYAAFLDLLASSAAKFAVRLWGYCLMGNHWHLVAQVHSVTELGRWLHWLCNRHVRRAHRANPAWGGGHIYQGRYKSFPVQDECYLFHVLRYVEANPLRARLVARAQDWPWSSLSSVPVRRGLVEVARPRLTRRGPVTSTGWRRSTSPWQSISSTVCAKAWRAARRRAIPAGWRPWSKRPAWNRPCGHAADRQRSSTARQKGSVPPFYTPAIFYPAREKEGTGIFSGRN